MENYIIVTASVYWAFVILHLITVYFATGKILLSNLLISLVPIVNAFSTVLGWIQLTNSWYNENKDNVLIGKSQKKKIPKP